MLTKNKHLRRKHQNDGNAEDGGNAEKRPKVDKTSEEEKERQGISVRMAIQMLEEDQRRMLRSLED